MMEELMLTIGHWWLNLIRWKPQAQRVYEQLERLSPDWPQISDEAIAAIESLSDAFIASKIARGAAHQEIRPSWQVGNPHPHWYRKTGQTFRGCEVVEPVPAYEEMQFAACDWRHEA